MHCRSICRLVLVWVNVCLSHGGLTTRHGLPPCAHPPTDCFFFDRAFPTMRSVEDPHTLTNTCRRITPCKLIKVCSSPVSQPHTRYLNRPGADDDTPQNDVTGSPRSPRHSPWRIEHVQHCIPLDFQGSMCACCRPTKKHSHSEDGIA